MEIQEIEVTISKDGTVQIAVRGIKGKSCLDLTRDLEQSLGGVILSREITLEGNEVPGTNTLDRPLHN